MKSTFLILLLSASSVLMAQENLSTTAGDTQTSESQQAQLAEWVRELSNLPPEQRAHYTEAFAKAKQAYARGSLAECDSHLNTCELYTTSNPNVWNLRASVLISQRKFDEALPLLERVRSENRQDAVANLSFSLLYLGAGEYSKCLEETTALIETLRYSNMEQLVHSLRFRRMLCYIMLGKEDEARAEVADIGPLDDSPLYYYSQAVFSLQAGDRRAAQRDMNAADTIYASVGYIPAYKQALEFSGILATAP